MDNGILSFNCYLSEPESEVFCEEQIYRVRPMKLLYYLVDDTMSLNEPPVDNSGIMQGRVFTRQKVPRTDEHIGREFIHWSDLNVAQDIVLFARTYRITSCDHYTKDFLERNGIKVREAEEIPLDPWTKRRSAKRIEAMRQSVESNGFVNAPTKLHLLACWLDSSNDFHGSRQRRTFRMTVFTVDDTVTLVETTSGLEGQVFLKRINLPCKTSRSRRYYRSWELYPGVWVDVFTRPMFIYGCEGTESRAFLQQQHGQTDFSDYERVLDEGPPIEHIIETPPTLKFIAEMLNGPFADKKFVLTYHVNSQEVDIAESGMRRKWSVGRAFLEGIHSHQYSIDHFTIGSTMTFYRWSFKLLEADPNTLQYLRSKETHDYDAV
uniref:EF-hand domain-containing protein 1 n=1 Tax=Ascaris suum TaxID=6253 RepID=F1L921_ASCSU